jgi:hypothetical protein
MFRALLGRNDVRPGCVLSLQTYSAYGANFNPHCHGLVPDDAVGFIQLFSDALNLDPHFHVAALDSIYIDDTKGNPAFRRVGPPTDAEVTRIAECVH